MFSLIPAWSNNFEKFWESICQRNLLFIKLRYLASVALFSFAIFSEKIFHIHLQGIQNSALLIISVSLFFYNIAIHLLRAKIKPTAECFNPLHLSLLQISVDLTLLLIIIYFTGGIESPFLPFFIFHMIIGSLILPGRIVYLSALAVVFSTTLIALAEYNGILQHYCIYGLLNGELYNRFSFVAITLPVFIFTLLFSVYLANNIARQLYVQEGQLVQALKELKTLNDKKQKYIMGVMHEIKSPVTASQSIVELILEGYLGKIPENIKEKLKRISFRNNEAIEMINDVLRISRLHLLGENEFEEVDPSTLLEEAKEKFQETAERKELTISIKLPKGKIQKLKCDKKVLQLALSNIFSNAVKYTPAKGKIEATVNFLKDFVEIKVCDNGKGIPPEEQEKVFIPFYRLRREGEKEGVGFGLALVKEIVNQHKGDILIESPSYLGSEENPGTCFLIRLPYVPSQHVYLSKSE